MSRQKLLIQNLKPMLPMQHRAGFMTSEYIINYGDTPSCGRLQLYPCASCQPGIGRHPNPDNIEPLVRRFVEDSDATIVHPSRGEFRLLEGTFAEGSRAQ
jgi:hypothetical protein